MGKRPRVASRASSPGQAPGAAPAAGQSLPSQVPVVSAVGGLRTTGGSERAEGPASKVGWRESLDAPLSALL